MPATTHEQTINVALGEVLDGLRRSWTARAEETGDVLVGGGRPDVLIEDVSGWPVVIEAEREHHAEAERDAIARLNRAVAGTNNRIETALALIYPPELHSLSGRRLRNALRRTKRFEYALYTHRVNQPPERLPEVGWLRGGVHDLAMLVHRATTPAPRVDALADELQRGVSQAVELFTRRHPYGSPRAARIAQLLDQEDDQDGQTRRMAMVVLINALIFHEALAQADFAISERGEQRLVHPVDQVRDEGHWPMPRLIDEWSFILERNYWPIFATAREILMHLPQGTAAAVCERLWASGVRLTGAGVSSSHDLMGQVFQRLIADRKFLATFYTRPASAALLAGLAIPSQSAPGGAAWNDAETLAALQIGDFACGTGTLLSAAYQRLGILHEFHGGDAAALHAPMMRNGLVGLDVLNIAVHLTAAMLASAHPLETFDGECLLTMPYDKDAASIGSLELLAEHVQPDMISAAAAVTAGGRNPEDVRDLVTRIGHGAFDLVIMNPPFTRSVGQEGEKIGAGNPAFAAFAAPKDVQSAMQRKLNSLAGQDTLGTGNAGLASHFVDLGLRKLNAEGTLAYVLPLSAAVGESWTRVRQAIERRFNDLTVISVAAAGSDDRSFSADTGIAEILLVAKRTGADDAERVTRFVSLRQRPRSAADGGLLADVIQSVETSRSLDRAPDGGSELVLGASVVGEVLQCDLDQLRAWSLVGIRDFSLAQAAYQLANGVLHLPGMPSADRRPVKTAAVGEIARMGPYHADINWSDAKGEPRGPFDLSPIAPGDVPTYPVIWAHDARAERRLKIAPDRQGRVKLWPNDQDRVDAKAVAIAETATRAHYNRDLQFNSQSLIAAMTERKTIGGHAWPSVIFDNPDHEFAFTLWCNSSLGLLMHWWSTNKTQSGRGRTSITAIPNIPVLDLSALSDEQHIAAREAFEELAKLNFLPFDQIDEDPARAELDRRLLVDVLGLPASLCAEDGPMDLLRRKLAAEPQIHGGKRTKVVFEASTDDQGNAIVIERSEQRDDRQR